MWQASGKPRRNFFKVIYHKWWRPVDQPGRRKIKNEKMYAKEYLRAYHSWWYLDVYSGINFNFFPRKSLGKSTWKFTSLSRSMQKYIKWHLHAFVRSYRSSHAFFQRTYCQFVHRVWWNRIASNYYCEITTSARFTASTGIGTISVNRIGRQVVRMILPK